MSGNITYNGKNFHEFKAVHTCAYVDQNDLHQAELTVRETLDFAARCQGIGHKAGQPLTMLATQLELLHNLLLSGSSIQYRWHCVKGLESIISGWGKRQG